MSVAFGSTGHWSRSILIRGLCTAIAAAILVDAFAARAPGLAILAVPFVIAAAALSDGGLGASIAMAVLSAFFVAIGIAFVAAVGFDAEWGDLVLAYLGIPLVAVLVFALLKETPRHQHSRRTLS